jgi:rubrerythrin
VVAGKKELTPVPERRPPDAKDRAQFKTAPAGATTPYPVWRCRVCGYLCARETPPETCPVCKASKDRFEPFPLGPPT